MTPLSESHPTLLNTLFPGYADKYNQVDDERLEVLPADIQSCTVDKAKHEETLWELDRCRSRINLLTLLQTKFREPERTIVCDIIANGVLMDSESQRYRASETITIAEEQAFRTGEAVALFRVREAINQYFKDRENADEFHCGFDKCTHTSSYNHGQAECHRKSLLKELGIEEKTTGVAPSAESFTCSCCGFFPPDCPKRFYCRDGTPKHDLVENFSGKGLAWRCMKCNYEQSGASDGGEQQ